MTQLAAADDLLDGRPHQLQPRVQLAWAAARAVLGLVVAAAVALLLLAAEAGGPAAAAAFVGVAAPWSVVAVLLARWRYAAWRWTAWDDALELAHGPVVRRASLVPYHRIQQIDVTRGPFARAFGLSNLVLRTAAATSDAEIPGIAAERAEALRRALLARAGIDDAV